MCNDKITNNEAYLLRSGWFRVSGDLWSRNGMAGIMTLEAALVYQQRINTLKRNARVSKPL